MAESLADPNLAFLLLIAGILGLYWELHAPGAILPGAIGIVLLCAAVFGLWENSPTWYGSVLILSALLFLATEVKFSSHGASGLVGAILLAFGALTLVSGPRRIQPVLVIAVSMALCSITIFLGYLGVRARRNVLRTGMESLVGESGVSRTDINLQGTVLVRGEYWQARSGAPIPPGARVSVERVDGMTLYVRQV
jgi:membrane-bound serine protease (ClpP class)